MENIINNSIFWVETDKISPNPYQPRRDFDEHALRDLADSIRQYGVLQPLVVTRKEVEKSDGGISVQYELVAGERRLRASKLAGVPQVPVIIRSGLEDAKLKLELAIIENLQREDLNAIDRAVAFQKLYSEFNLSHADIGKRMGKSREYVSNTLRLLSLPPQIQEALAGGKLGEGHARTLLSLNEKPDEQFTLFQEVMLKKLSVRETESIARNISRDKVRKRELVVPPTVAEYQEEIAQKLGTRVYIEPRDTGGRLVIDFMSPEDLESILKMLEGKEKRLPVETAVIEKPEALPAPEAHAFAGNPNSFADMLRLSLQEHEADTHEFKDFTV